MKYYNQLFFLLIVVSQSVTGQVKKFNTELETLSQLLQTVETKSSIFDLSIHSETPGIAKFSKTETTKKGKIIETIYEFSFSDIDVNTVRYSTVKDQIKVHLVANKNQKMIKEISEDKTVKYKTEFHILASDVNNARELIDQIKFLIPISNIITENKLALSGFDDRIKWLQNNITNITLEKSTLEQKLEISSDYPGSVIFSVTESTSKSMLRNKYYFNLSYINEHGILFKNKGSDIVLTLPTKRNFKAIKVTNNGKLKAYVTSVEILCNNVQNAKELQKVFQDIIPMAAQRFSDQLPKKITQAKGIQILNKKLGSLVFKEELVQQHFSGDCLQSFSLINESGNKTEKQVFDFNLIDINPQAIDIQVKAKKVRISIGTRGKNNFIKQTINETEYKYRNEFEIFCSSIEDAVYSKRILSALIENCTNSIKKVKVSFSDLKQSLQTIQNEKMEVAQQLEMLDKNIVKFTCTTVNSKKPETLIQEFKLKDLNPQTTNITISGKQITVSIETHFQEKIIKTYKNGSIKNYSNAIVFYCDGIENARKIHDILVDLSGKK